MNERSQKTNLKKIFSEPFGSRSAVLSGNACTEIHGTSVSVSYDGIVNSRRITTEDIWENAFKSIIRSLLPKSDTDGG